MKKKLYKLVIGLMLEDENLPLTALEKKMLVQLFIRLGFEVEYEEKDD